MQCVIQGFGMPVIRGVLLFGDVDESDVFALVRWAEHREGFGLGVTSKVLCPMQCTSRDFHDIARFKVIGFKVQMQSYIA